MLEAAMLIPVMLVLLMGMIEMARVTWTYYQLQKTMYQLARYAGTRQGINFCTDGDAELTSAINWALTGTTDASTEPKFANLDATSIEIRVEREDEEGNVVECDCSATGCDPSAGGRNPGWIVVSIPNGYPVIPRIPGLPQDQILLRPQVRVPFGGT
jgi:hypothetical protein